jgi:CheY-like chemotaxis protein
MPAPAERFDPHCHSVLVVDDFDGTRDAIVTLLQAKGLAVVGAESGPDALDLFQAGLRPCVVLLDLRMPGMDGWETWERMKALPALAETPVVILSADKADDARAKTVGIREFLRKPIDGRDLYAAIEKYCEQQTPSDQNLRGGRAHEHPSERRTAP